MIGAGAAGMAAATRARRVDPIAQITILEASQEYSRGTCSLPYYVSGEVTLPSLTGISRESLSESRIELRLDTPAEQIDPTRRVVRSRGLDIPFDQLIVGLGSRPKAVPTVTGSHPRLWALRSIADAEQIRDGLNTLRPRKVAVIGGGYLGLEMAEVLTARGCRVTIFHRQDTLMRLVQPCARAVLDELSQHGVTIKTNCEVCLVDPDCRQRTVEYLHGGSSRQSEGFDGVLLAPGIVPETQLLARAGARLGRLGGVLVDGRGQTSLSNIWAAGDGVELPSQRGGASRFVPLATAAARLGRVCGENAAGGSLRLPEPLAAIAIRLFTLQVAAAGHPEDWRHAVTHTLSFGNSQSGFPRRREGHAIFFTEPRSGRIIGAQFVAPEASALANLASLAMSQDMTLDQIQDLDASYTPPLSALWHPFYLMARQNQKSLAGVSS